MTLRDYYETGEPLNKARPRYAEHMNTLAKSGTPHVGEAVDPRRSGYSGSGRSAGNHKTHPALTADEKRWLNSLLNVESFDALYRKTVAELRKART